MADDEYPLFLVSEATCTATVLSGGTPCNGVEPPTASYDGGRTRHEVSRCDGCRYYGKRMMLDLAIPVELDRDTGQVTRDPIRQSVYEVVAQAATQAYVDTCAKAADFRRLVEQEDEMYEICMDAVVYEGEGPGDLILVDKTVYPHGSRTFVESAPDPMPEGCEIWHEQWAMDFWTMSGGGVPPVIAPDSAWREAGVARGALRYRKGDGPNIAGQLAARVLLAGGAVWHDRLAEHLEELDA